ncbi:MAG TPA: DUF4013 domain-containing protein [Methanoregula sp.]|nr:DUF4013 domain-containing protein [Methanoregula sp.]
MDYGNMLSDSFAYAKDAVIGKWMQWILLLIATLLLCLPLLGYLVKVLRGDKPAPEVDGWGTLFVDGIKLFIISLIWAIPSLIIFFFFFGSMIGGLLMEGNPSAMIAALTGALIYLVLFFIVALITGLLSLMGAIRFARTGSMGEAFNFGAILETIGKIGWGTYIIALIVLLIVQFVIGIILSIIAMIPVLGGIIQFVLFAPIVIFEYRYICQIYDAAGV